MAADDSAYIIEGAETTGAVGRAAHYAATQGNEGVTAPGDFKVTPTPTASTKVRVAAGSATILNRQATVGESYQGLKRTYTDVQLTVNGTARYDLIVAYIVDPDFPPWQSTYTPAQMPNGQFFRIGVIEGVPSNTTTIAQTGVTYSAIPLARVSVPASGNITADKIVDTDIRKVAQPNFKPFRMTWSPADGAPFIPSPNIGPFGWFPQFSGSTFCPSWATKLHLTCTVSGLYVWGNITGHIRTEFGWNGGTAHLDTQLTGLANIGTSNDQQGTRITVQMADTIVIPDAGWRDKLQYIRTGTQINSGSTGQYRQDMWTTVTVDGLFEGAAQ